MPEKKELQCQDKKLDNMAKKKQKVLDSFGTPPVKAFTEPPVTPDVSLSDSIKVSLVDDLQREMILDLRAKGFDDNRIAARLEIRKDIVETIR